MNQKIRPIVICVFRHNGRILVAESKEPCHQKTFYRPLGGGIEFGEHSRDALVREIREELGAEIAGLRYLGTIENIFTYAGEMGHEIVQVYDGAFVDRTLYERPWLDGIEMIAGTEIAFKAIWKMLSDFQSLPTPPLYPDKLLALLID